MPTRLLLPALVLLLALAALLLHGWGIGATVPSGAGPARPADAPSPADAAPMEGHPRVADAAALQRTSIGTPTEAGPGIRLHGRVVDAAGAPVAGQELELMAGRTPANADPHVQFVGAHIRDFVAVGGTSTGGDGSFTMPCPAGLLLRLRTAGEQRVFRQGAAEVAPSAVDVDLGDLVAQAACSIDGRVCDGVGRAIAGAELRCVRDVRGADEAAAAKTASAADGSFHFGGLDNGSWQLRAQAPGFGAHQGTVTLQPEQQLRDCAVTLLAGDSIEGRVLDESGAPVAGASVGAGNGQGPGPTQQTGADGSFSLQGLAPGKWNLRASKNGHRRTSASDVQSGSRDVVLRLPHLATMTGTVLDGDGAPVASSRVRAVPAGQSPERDRISALFDPGVLTGADGTFVIPNPAAGRYRVIASGDHLDAVVAVEVVQDQPGVPLRIVVETGGVARFAVRSPEGVPVAGAKVRVVEADAPERQRPMVLIGGGNAVDPDDLAEQRVRKAVTDAQGACAVRGLRPGRWRAGVETDAFVLPAPVPFAIAGSETIEVTVTLAAAGFAEVRVSDREGAPLPGRRVEVEGPLGTAPMRQLSAVTDAAGRARVGPLGTGRHAAALGKTLDHEALGGGVTLVTPGGGASYRDSRVEFEVTAGASVAVRLVQPELVVLQGLVTDAGGPLANGSVQILREESDAASQSRFGLDGSARSTHTRPDGSFAIADLEPGRYRVRYGRRRQAIFAELALDLPAGRRTVDVELPLVCGSVRVRALREDAAVAGARATLRREGDAPRAGDPGIRDFAFDSAPAAQAVCDGEGIATFADVPAGRYVVGVEAAHHLPGRSGPVAVAGGEPATVTVTLQPCSRITGTVVDAAGAEVAQAQLEWRSAVQTTFTALSVGARFEIDNLVPGDYVLRARRSGRSASVAQPAFGPDCTVRVEGSGGTPVQLRVPD